jgi:hypothetical protein
MKIGTGQVSFSDIAKEAIITTASTGVSNIILLAQNMIFKDLTIAAAKTKLLEFYTSRVFYGILGIAATAYITECAVRRVFLYHYGHADISMKKLFAINACLIPLISPYLGISGYDSLPLGLTIAISAVIRYLIGEPILIKQWVINDHEVNLYRNNNRLEFVGNKGIIGACFPDDIRIDRLGKMGAHLLPTKHVSFYDKKTEDVGHVAKGQKVTKDEWAVTLFSAGKDWYGHAMLAIEGIDKDGRTFTSYAHLTKKGGVEIIDALKNDNSLLTFTINKIANTWITEKEKLEKMLVNIKSEVGKKKDFSTLSNNCLTWAQEKLKIADIEFELSALSTVVAIPNIEC